MANKPSSEAATPGAEASKPASGVAGLTAILGEMGVSLEEEKAGTGTGKAPAEPPKDEAEEDWGGADGSGPGISEGQGQGEPEGEPEEPERPTEPAGGEPEEPEKPTAPAGVEKRIAQLTARARRAEREARELRQRLSGEPAPAGAEPVDDLPGVRESLKERENWEQRLEHIQRLQRQLRGGDEEKTQAVQKELERVGARLSDWSAEAMEDWLGMAAQTAQRLWNRAATQYETRAEQARARYAQVQQQADQAADAQFPWVDEGPETEMGAWAERVRNYVPQLQRHPAQRLLTGVIADWLARNVKPGLRPGPAAGDGKPRVSSAGAAGGSPKGAGVKVNKRQLVEKRLMAAPSRENLVALLAEEFPE